MTLGHNAAGIIPQGSEISFEAAAAGQFDPFMAMIDWCERTVSKAVLGGTLTSQAGGKTSTNAQGNVHNEVRHDILVADAKQLHGFFQGMIHMLLSINGYQVSRRRLPKFVFDTSELEDIGKFSTGVSTLVQAGMKSIPLSWVHKKVGIPVPQNNEPVLEGAPTPAPLAGLSVSTYRAFAALSTVPGEIRDPAQEALDSASSTPDDALDISAASYPLLDDAQLRQLLKQALFVADVRGRLNADS